MANFHSAAKHQRIFFASVPVIYLLFLAIVALYRSADRRSIFTHTTFEESPTTAASESMTGVESKVQMRDFVRYEMTHGRLGWEIKASDAKIYVNDGISHIGNAKLVLHRDKGEPDVRIAADSAQLDTAKSEVQRALLTGNVRIEDDGGLIITTSIAEYDVRNRLMRSPARVTVLGSGFELLGDRLEFPLDAEQVTLIGNVTSRFEPGLKPPERLKAGEEN